MGVLVVFRLGDCVEGFVLSYDLLGCLKRVS